MGYDHRTDMRLLLSMLLVLSLGACDESSPEDAGPPLPGTDAGAGVDGGADAGAVDDDAGSSDAGGVPGGGCGLAPAHGAGGAQVSRMFSAAAGGERSFFITRPTDYDPDVPHPVIVAFAGTNWSGAMIRPYFALETDPSAIYVYPDLEFHDFEGWGNLGGWLLGPHANPADGSEDIELVRELLDLLESQYCVDTARVFATGHSWGGDMAAVVGCFLGDRFTAVAPAAANRPYWFEPNAGEVGCVGEAAVWTFFGQNETHFTNQSFAGEFGDQQNDFWRDKHACGDGTTDLGVGASGECIAWDGCSSETRYCFYEPAAGHQIPSYFTATIMEWFASF